MNPTDSDLDDKMSEEKNMLEFSHRSVLLDECMEGLDIKPDGIYVDVSYLMLT